MSQLPPVRRQVSVPGTVEAAFTVFTDEIGQWWPIEDHSVYGEGAAVAFRDGRVVERGPGGTRRSGARSSTGTRRIGCA